MLRHYSKNMVEVADETEKSQNDDTEETKEEQQEENLTPITGLYRVKEWRCEPKNDNLIRNIF